LLGLDKVATALVAPGKGVLAADETTAARQRGGEGAGHHGDEGLSRHA
jgi:fructose-bisphosphate aldolase class 1